MSLKPRAARVSLDSVKLFVLLFFLVLSAAAETVGVALVVDVRGKIPGLQLLDSLASGRQLAIPAGAQATLSFLEAGRRARLQGPGVFVVEAGGVKQVRGAGRAVQELPRSIVAREIRDSFNWDKMAGVRHRDLGWLVDATLLEPQAVLHWQAEPQVTEVEISVEELPGFRRVLRQTLPANPSQVSVSLEAGRTYELGLTAYTPGSPPSEAAPQQVRVLSHAEAQRLLQLEKQATSPEDLLEMCSLWLQHGVRSRAAGLARQLLDRYPQSARLQELARP